MAVFSDPEGADPRSPASVKRFDGAGTGAALAASGGKNAIPAHLIALKIKGLAGIHSMFTLFGNHKAQLLRFVM
ncbi:hypothetical protein [Hoeflea sp.]|uniref:hypothetical protein n=1 Tax=Hoeflea sp. TaxID=1940281 RepID=UPI003A8D21CD